MSHLPAQLRQGNPKSHPHVPPSPTGMGGSGTWGGCGDLLQWQRLGGDWGGERGIKVCQEGAGQGGAPQNLAPPTLNPIPSPEGSGRLRKRQCCSRINGPDSLMSTSTWPTLEEGGMGQIGGGPSGLGGA